jgi:hypothetical protein
MLLLSTSGTKIWWWCCGFCFWLQLPAGTGRPFDVVFANILRGPLLNLHLSHGPHPHKMANILQSHIR